MAALAAGAGWYVVKDDVCFGVVEMALGGGNISTSAVAPSAAWRALAGAAGDNRAALYNQPGGRLVKMSIAIPSLSASSIAVGCREGGASSWRRLKMSGGAKPRCRAGRPFRESSCNEAINARRYIGLLFPNHGG